MLNPDSPPARKLLPPVLELRRGGIGVAGDLLGSPQHPYEKTGKSKKAKAAYQRFIEAWKDADPEIQGRVGEARARLNALAEKKAAE